MGYNCLQSKSVCVLDHKGQIVVRWLLPDRVWVRFVCVYGFFITSSRKLSQPSLRALKIFPNITSYSPSFSTIHPPPLSGSGWIDAWMRERQQRICIFNFRPWRFFHLSISAMWLWYVCLMSGNCSFWSFCQFFGGFFHCVGTVLCARRGPTLAAGQITETALRFLLENNFRNIRVLARHASRVLNKIQNVLDNLASKLRLRTAFVLYRGFFSGSLAPKYLNSEFMESPFWSFCSLFLKAWVFVYFVCIYGSDHADWLERRK